jgi:shikimate dehydrogenase
MDKMKSMPKKAINYKLCVIGNPIQQSKSPWVHNQFAQQFGLLVDYAKIESAIGNFNNTVQDFIQSGGIGANVTAPFKHDAFALANDLSSRALIAKSVNTLQLKPDGKLLGDNTDGIGLIRDIQNNIGYSLTGKSIIILGAGGAVQGILDAILSTSPQQVLIANRTEEKALHLASQFTTNNIKVFGGNLSILENLKVDVIIDGTSFDSKISLPASFSVNPEGLCYDLKYSDTLTHIMKWGYLHNIKNIADGLGMLIEQAAESFYIWTGFYPNTKPVLDKAHQEFHKTF